MGVRLAAQLMSETTATTLKHFGEQGLLKSTDWDDTSKFIALVDAWFDLFNSKAPHDKKDSRVAYGIRLKEQNHVLQTMMTTMNNVKVGNKNNMYPFQKGILVSCQSLLKLYQFLNAKFGLDYILTYRLNQDGLEHFYGYLRQMGSSHQHPSAVQVKFRLRAYLLGKNCELVGSNYNTEKENGDVSLSEMSFPKSSADHCEIDNTEKETIESELLLSAMLFSTDQSFDSEGNENSEVPTVKQASLEDCMEAEGLRYVGGFITRKFPQYSLGGNVTSDDNTWVGQICRNDGKLMVPSEEFYEKLKLMEKLFVCFHGKKLLKPGKCCMSRLSKIIHEHVDLPKEVVHYFVKCRVFFRIRILNRSKKDTSNKVQKKMKKLIR